MEFTEKIKQKIGQLVFQRELRTNKRLKEVCNIDTAQSIGILYEATSEEQIKQIKPKTKGHGWHKVKQFNDFGNVAAYCEKCFQLKKQQK